MAIDEKSMARGRLLEELKEHALVLEQVVLTSGRTSSYLIDAKRAILRPAGFAALSSLVAAQAIAWEATAVGGMTMGADPIACAALAGGAPVKAFFVRKETKAHGLQRRIEGPDVAGRRVLAVEDTSTTGNSVLTAVAALREAGAEVAGVAVLVDRGARAHVTELGLPYRAAYEQADLGV